MRDYSLLLIVLSVAALALYRPWLGVLGLAVVGVMHPHGYGNGFMRHFPAYAVLLAATVAGAAARAARGRKELALAWENLTDWRVLALGTLFLWFGVTTQFAVTYYDAMEKYQQVTKMLPSLGLTLLLITTRERLHALLVVIALSVTLVAAKGGYWAVMTGFSDRVYGPPGSAYYGNNEFAVAVTMVIPLLVAWLHQTRDKGVRFTLMAAIVLCYGSVISSWSRGALLALAAMSSLLILYSRRKLLVIPVLCAVLALFLVQVPGGWFERMQTLTAIGADGSAQGRLEVWRIALEFASERPIHGGGFNAWLLLTPFRDWHSAYFEVLAEHGFVGLGLWLAVVLGTLVSLARVSWRARSLQLEWLANWAVALQASLVGYAVGSLTLGTTYWELTYHLVVISVILVRLEALETASAER